MSAQIVLERRLTDDARASGPSVVGRSETYWKEAIRLGETRTHHTMTKPLALLCRPSRYWPMALFPRSAPHASIFTSPQTST